MATKQNADHTTSFVMIAPATDFPGSRIELVAGSDNGRRALTLRDAQQEYVFIEN